jgi:hypothetical protein
MISQYVLDWSLLSPTICYLIGARLHGNCLGNTLIYLTDIGLARFVRVPWRALAFLSTPASTLISCTMKASVDTVNWLLTQITVTSNKNRCLKHYGNKIPSSAQRLHQQQIVKRHSSQNQLENTKNSEQFLRQTNLVLVSKIPNKQTYTHRMKLLIIVSQFTNSR